MIAQDSAIQNNTSRAKRFVREVKSELKKVSWPTKNQLIANTGVVFVSVIVSAVLIWVIDTAFSQVLRLILK